MTTASPRESVSMDRNKTQTPAVRRPNPDVATSKNENLRFYRYCDDDGDDGQKGHLSHSTAARQESLLRFALEDEHNLSFFRGCGRALTLVEVQEVPGSVRSRQKQTDGRAPFVVALCSRTGRRPADNWNWREETKHKTVGFLLTGDAKKPQHKKKSTSAPSTHCICLA